MKPCGEEERIRFLFYGESCEINLGWGEEEGQVILKEIKQLKETLEMTPADRTDLIEEAQKRLSVLEEYAPKMMDADEIKAVIQTVLSELGIETPTAKEKGKIMKELMPRVKGKADGKEVNQILASMMK